MNIASSCGFLVSNSNAPVTVSTTGIATSTTGGKEPKSPFPQVRYC